MASTKKQGYSSDDFVTEEILHKLVSSHVIDEKLDHFASYLRISPEDANLIATDDSLTKKQKVRCYDT